ncbi:MAG TPA: hypothetical protein VGJ84_00305, partial [Polyangiaceae bacterium]
MDTLGAQGRFSARCVFKFLSFVLALGAVSLGTQRAFAYPWMIKHGYGGCPTCHADPSGGELLTPYGRLQGDLMLRMHYAADQETPSQAAGFLWGLYQPPAWLLLGGSYRHMTILEGARPPPPSSPSRPSKPTLSTFPMQADLYAQARLGAFRGAASLGLAEVGPDSPHARAAQITSAPAYRLNLVSRTHWIGWDFGEQYTLRAGRLNLPFGVRIPEHTAWVRDYTRTDRESDQQHGIAVAYNGDSARGEIMLILGNYQVRPDRFRERGYSLYIEGRLADDQRIGVSSLITRAL